MDREKLRKAIAQNPNFTETRKASLYSNFSRLEDINPDGFEANIIAWREVLETALRAHAFADRTCIEASPELIKALSDPKSGIPLSLDAVFASMLQDGTIVPLDKFNRSRLSRVLSWAASFVWDRTHVPVSGEKYVSVNAVKTSARQLVAQLQQAAERHGSTRAANVFSLAEVRALLPGFSELDVRCCLASAELEHACNVIKLRGTGPITEADKTIVSLRAHITELSQREQTLTHEIRECDDLAREKVRVNRHAAKTVLKKRALLEKTYERTLVLIDQLETVLHKIDDADDNKHALDALKASSGVLRELNRGTDVETAESVMEGLQNAVADTDEVSASLAGLQLDDEAELDTELAELEREELAKRMPSAPVKPAETIETRRTSIARRELQKETRKERENRERGSRERGSRERESRERGSKEQETRESEARVVAG